MRFGRALKPGYAMNMYFQFSFHEILTKALLIDALNYLNFQSSFHEIRTFSLYITLPTLSFNSPFMRFHIGSYQALPWASRCFIFQFSFHEIRQSRSTFTRKRSSDFQFSFHEILEVMVKVIKEKRLGYLSILLSWDSIISASLFFREEYGYFQFSFHEILTDICIALASENNLSILLSWDSHSNFS